MSERYRKKPVVIEAVHWDGTVNAATAIIDWMLANDGTARYHDDGPLGPLLRIDVLGGTVTAVPGDWIIKGAQGEFGICDPEIFEATCEPAVSEPA